MSSQSCNLTAAIALDCLDSIGGIKTLWVSSNADLGTITAGATSGITACTGATGSFFQIEVAKDVASFTETFNISNVNGTAFFTQEVTIPVQHLSSAKRAQIQLLTYNRNSKVLFEDNNGLYWLVGLTRGCVVSAGTSVSGVAPGDFNGYNGLVLQAMEPEMAYQVSSLAALTGITITNA
jgi:hypothetical protein